MCKTEAMTGILSRQNHNVEILGDVKSRAEVMEEIKGNPAVYREYLNLSGDFRERFTEFCMGVRGVQMTYDPFFKRIFDAEVHPERLSGFLSQVLGRTTYGEADAAE